MVRWGFCIPKECSNTDLERAIEEKLEAKASVMPSMCQTNTAKAVGFGTYVTLVIFILIGVCIGISSTLYSCGYCIYNFGKFLFVYSTITLNITCGTYKYKV